MGVLHIYNQIDNTHQTINGCGKIKELLPTYDFSKSIILKAGNKIDENYFVTKDDVIFLRKMPEGITAIGIGLIALIGVVAIGGAAITVANAVGDYKTRKLQEQMEQVQQNADNLAETITQLPFVKGASNTSALGKTVPYLFGSMYHTPYKSTDGFYTISGTYGVNQYYNVALNLGFGEIFVDKVLCGEETIIERTAGLSYNTQYNFDSSSTFYDSVNKIELCAPKQTFTNSAFNQKVVATSDGSEIVHEHKEDAEELIRILSENTMKVEVCIQFNGLREYVYDDNGDGAWQARKATVRPYWSNDDGKKWNEFYFSGMSNNSISVNSQKTIRFVATKTFSAAEAYGKTIKIKLVKETPKAESNTVESCYLTFYQCWCYDSAKSTSSKLVACQTEESFLTNRTTRLSVKIAANDNTDGSLNEFHALCSAKARTWNGSSWSTSKSVTRNPAAVILEILTSPYHKASQYSDDEIDLNSLGALYEYCDENYFYADGLLTSTQKKRDLISSILSNINATMFINSSGLLDFAIDKVEDTPVALLNAENLIDITYAKDLTRRVDGLKVTYTNRENWQTDTFYAMYDGGEKTDDDTCTELALNYVTDYEQAYKIAQRKLRQSILQPKELTVNVGREGDYYPLYSTVLLQYTNFRQGICSSVITGFTKNSDGDITAITISDYVTFEENKNYGVIIQAITSSGRKLYNIKVSGSGTTKTLTLATSISSDELQPELDNNISFGVLDDNSEFTKITNTMKITEISVSNKNEITLKLKDYNSAIYESGDIPEYKSNLTSPPKTTPDFPDLYKTKIEGVPSYDDINSLLNTTFQNTTAPDVPVVTAVANRDGIKITSTVDGTLLNNSIKKFTAILYKGSDDETGTELTFADSEYTYEFNRTTDGYPEVSDLANWSVKVKATNYYELESDYSEAVEINTTSYGTWKFDFSSSNIQADVVDRTVTLTLTVTKQNASRTMYGTPQFKVSISRIGYEIDSEGNETSTSIADVDSDGNAVYYAPQLYKSAYPTGTTTNGDYQGNEDNYKDTSNADGYITSSSNYTQTLPLYGQEKYTQNESGEWVSSGKYVQNTSYMFKISAYTEAYETDAVSGFTVTALCSSIRDIVYAHDYYKNLYVEKLSAINANIGLISQGGFGDFANWKNFWALSTLSADEAGTDTDVLGGSFRVGDENEYIMVIPAGATVNGETNNSDTAIVKIKAGNITLTSSGTEFSSGTYIYDDTDANKRMHLLASGIEIQLQENGSWKSIGQMTIDKFGNLYVTNSTSEDVNFPKIKEVISTDSKIYHLENSELDQNGENGADFSFTGSYEESTLINGNNYLLNGTAKKTVETETVCFWTDSDIVTDNKIIKVADGSVSDNMAKRWNDKLGVSYFKMS